MDSLDKVVDHFDSLENKPLLQKLIVVHELLDHSEQPHTQQSLNLQAIVLFPFMPFGRRVLAFLGHFLIKLVIGYAYINFADELEYQEDLVDCLVHLKAAHHDLDDVVDGVGVHYLLLDLLLFTLLIPKEDPLVIVVKAD